MFYSFEEKSRKLFDIPYHSENEKYSSTKLIYI